MREEKIDNLWVEIFTPEKKVYEGHADAILFPSEDGDLFVLPKHLPMIAALKEGTITLQLEKKKQKLFSVSPGILEIDNDKIKIIIETAEDISEETVSL